MPTDPFDDKQKEYYDTSRSSRPQQYNLPSIRDMFGDVLEQPVILRHMPSSSEVGTGTPRRRTYPASTHEIRRISQSHQLSYSVEQPPLMRFRPVQVGSPEAPPPPTLYSNSSSYPPHERRSYEHTDLKEVQPRASSSHSFDVFVASGEGLVHQRSSNTNNFKMSKEESISLSTGRHVCPNCGRRFEKISHFKNHLTIHSGEKPYECPWPGCGKAFSASSNMRRHQRSHLKYESSEQKNTTTEVD